jgi:hypothetical protein
MKISGTFEASLQSLDSHAQGRGGVTQADRQHFYDFDYDLP